MLNKIIRKVKLLMRLVFINETIILLEHKFYHKCRCDAVIKRVDNSIVHDVLSFQSPYYLKTFQDFLEKMDYGYYAYLNGKCVHRSWVKSNQQTVYPHWAYPVKLIPSQYFIHYCETAYQARGLGIYPAVLSKIVTDLNDTGKIMMSINEKNHASLKGAKKAGFIEKEKIQIIVILGIKFFSRKIM